MMKYIKGKVFKFVFSLLILFSQVAICNVFTVTNTFDNVLGSLRNAMLNANAVQGKDTIDFNIPGSQWQIVLLSELPVITDSVFIDGLSQPGSSFATSTLVEIVGNSNFDFGIDISGYGTKVIGLKIINFTNGAAFFDRNNTSAIGNIILSYIIVDNCFYALWLNLRQANGLKISNCLFSNFSTTCLYVRLKNNSENIELSSNHFIGSSGISHHGIYIQSGIIGFDTTSRINIVDNIFDSLPNGIILKLGGYCTFINIENNSFYNQNGNYSIELGSGITGRSKIKFGTIHNNYIDSTCSGYGIQVGGAYGEMVMDSIEVNNNTILTSGTSGVEAKCYSSQNDECKLSNVCIYDNFIRNSQHGIRYFFKIGNPFCLASQIESKRNEISYCQSGVFIDVLNLSGSISGSKVQYLLIDSNNIHDNSQFGVIIAAFSSTGSLLLKEIKIRKNVISQNSLDGIIVSSYKASYNGLKFTQNSIFNNGLKGISEIDQDNGLYLYGKPRIPAPQFDSLLYNGSKGDLYGHLQSLPNRVYKIEFFSSVNMDSTGYGEGETYLFTRRIVTDSTGLANFHFSLPQSSIGLYISSTATDSIINHTSEFSNAINNIISSVSDIEDGINSFSVFPNPANGSASLYRVDWSEELQIDMCDLTGRVIQSVAFPFGVNSIKISLEGLSSGMYLIKGRSILNSYRSAKLLVRKE